jgi:predicted transcriptional regulator
MAHIDKPRAPHFIKARKLDVLIEGVLCARSWRTAEQVAADINERDAGAVRYRLKTMFSKGLIDRKESRYVRGVAHLYRAKTGEVNAAPE